MLQKYALTVLLCAGNCLAFSALVVYYFASIVAVAISNDARDNSTRGKIA